LVGGLDKKMVLPKQLSNFQLDPGQQVWNRGYVYLLFLETYQLSENSSYPENINSFGAEGSQLWTQSLHSFITPLA
jgi:hypothetical protein